MDKRIVGFGRITLLVTMLAGLAACGGGGGESNTTSSNTAASNTASSPPVVTPPVASNNPVPTSNPPASQPPSVAPDSPPSVEQAPLETPPASSPPDEVAQLPAPQLKTITLSWTPPTENTDGSALVNLSGYEIHYGTQRGHYTQTITVNNAGLNRYVVDNLEPGTYFFALTALTASGAKSNFSGEVSKTL